MSTLCAARSDMQSPSESPELARKNPLKEASNGITPISEGCWDTVDGSEIQ